MKAAAARVRVSVGPLPCWLDSARLLGAEPRESTPIDLDHVRVELELAADEAAYLLARLRGLGIDGRPLEVATRPALARELVRAGRLREARARRDSSPGFLRSQARASGEGRFSLTPEALALALGERAAGRSVVDACCGSGGNSIGFARAGSRVTAIELAAERLDEARHNARIYGVSDRVRFVHGDARELVRQQRAEILFIDPPWGEDYDKRRTTRASFPLLDALLHTDLSGYAEIWLKVPSSFEVASVPTSAASAWFGVAGGDRQRIKFLLLTCAVPR